MAKIKNKNLTCQEVKKQLNKIIKLFQKKTLKTLQDKINAENKSKNKIEDQKNSLQETIDYLRVCVKYSIYDLEATRREIESCKKLLKDNGIEL